MNLFRRRALSPLASPARFRELYERSHPAVFRYIYGLTGGPQDDVEDLTAETFLRAWKARHGFQGDEASATGWLIRIAKRLVIDRYRRSVQAIHNLPADPPAESTPEQTAVADEQINFLYRLLGELPDEPREILALRYLLGWRVNDIAEYMGATENSVSVTIHRTLSRLRVRWAESDTGHLAAAFVPKENES
ncbi:MAG TPA: sigma-70 family RNA polymerase sigma factor [Anaerolineales bacterium]|nr:sigma-70 family RNA polymerase sigma factor [Anaerolineales bacterium]